MPLGPGKYGDALTVARAMARAPAALLIVFEGEHGNGFSVQAPVDFAPLIPAILRAIADKVEADIEAGGE